MSITSIEFLVFIAVAFIFYYVMPLKYRWVVLFLCSAYFVINGNSWMLLMVMLGVVTITYFSALLLDKKKSKLLVAVAVLINVCVLILFKEVNFFLGTARGIGNIFGCTFGMPNLNLVAPIGISYYTLNLISYVLDVYWGVSNVQRNYFKFFLFVGYFPSLTSGPILRYRDLESTLYEGHRFDYKTLCFGIQRILWGLFKKLVVAERVSVIVNTVYGDYSTYAGFYIFVAIILFVVQMYADFSGYVDIVIGVSELFGIVLPENFETPFFSKNVSEFWRRWHMTLGAWLKDYVLYPILKTPLWQNMGAKLKKKFGKKYGKKVPVWTGLLVSWFIIGMWHGGAWNYIIGVGLLMWLFIVLGEMLEPVFVWVIKKLQINTECFSWKFFQALRTFFCFAIGLSLFRSYGGFLEGVRIWKAAFSTFNPWILVDGSLLKLGLDVADVTILILSIAIMGASGIIREFVKRPLREWLADQNIIFRWLVLYLLIFAVIIFGCYGIGYDSQAFIYEQF